MNCLELWRNFVVRWCYVAFLGAIAFVFIVIAQCEVVFRETRLELPTTPHHSSELQNFFQPKKTKQKQNIWTQNKQNTKRKKITKVTSLKVVFLQTGKGSSSSWKQPLKRIRVCFPSLWPRTIEPPLSSNCKIKTLPRGHRQCSPGIRTRMTTSFFSIIDPTEFSLKIMG